MQLYIKCIQCAPSMDVAGIHLVGGISSEFSVILGLRKGLPQVSITLVMNQLAA